MAELLLINKLNFGDTFKNFTISFPKEKFIQKTTFLSMIKR